MIARVDVDQLKKLVLLDEEAVTDEWFVRQGSSASTWRNIRTSPQMGGKEYFLEFKLSL
jgi:hypothetical protein